MSASGAENDISKVKMKSFSPGMYPLKLRRADVFGRKVRAQQGKAVVSSDWG